MIGYQLTLVGILDLAGEQKLLKRDYDGNRANMRDYLSYLHTLSKIPRRRSFELGVLVVRFLSLVFLVTGSWYDDFVCCFPYSHFLAWILLKSF